MKTELQQLNEDTINGLKKIIKDMNVIKTKIKTSKIHGIYNQNVFDIQLDMTDKTVEFKNLIKFIERG